MHLDLVDVIKVSLTFTIGVLLLDSNSSIVIELALEEKMVGIFNFKIVARTKRMDFSLKSVHISDRLCWLISKSQQIDSVF